MREHRDYGSTLSVSKDSMTSRPDMSHDRSLSGADVSSSASEGPEAGTRASGFGRMEGLPFPSGSTGSILQSPNSAAEARGRGRERSLSSTKRELANGARKLLNRASLGYYGNTPDLEEQVDGARAHRPSITPSMSATGARARWKSLRRIKTMSILAPLDLGAYEDRYGHNRTNAEENKHRIPQMLPSTKPDPDSTPIPTLPFMVLCLTVFGEFSSVGVAGPFLFFMINGFDVGGEAEVGFWAGVVCAVFFGAQFLTSMLWASAASRYGRRVVLFVSLAGNCASLILFGTSRNLKMAIAIRLMQGLFNGAVGVAKGAMRDLTDSTNETRAYGIMGFCWSMGGIVGPVLGGLLEHPVEKYPALFGNSKLFAQYPYLLPCLVMACTTGSGAVMTLFLGRDGGPRSGVVVLPEKDTERGAPGTGVSLTTQTRVAQTATANMGSTGRSAGKRKSGYSAKLRASGAGSLRPSENAGGEWMGETSLTPTRRVKDFSRTLFQQQDWRTGRPPSPAGSPVTVGTRANTTMDSTFDNRSVTFPSLSRTAARRQSVTGVLARHRNHSAATSAMQNTSGDRAASMSVYDPDFEEVSSGGGSELSFAQRFLLANDDAVLSLSDLWVAAAIGDDGANALDDDEAEDGEEEAVTLDKDEDGTSDAGLGSPERRSFNTLHQTSESSPLLSRRPLVPAHFIANRYLSIPGRSNAQSLHSAGNARPTVQLATLPEGAATSAFTTRTGAYGAAGGVSGIGADVGQEQATQQSVWALLPLAVVAQYGIISWHAATFDQVFMAFMVTDVKSGGLGLTAAHFSQLIAAMAVCQMVCQFRVYPTFGPPHGKYTHLTMLRMGLALYLPVYTLFPWLRNFITSTDATVMSGMIFVASLRLLANVTAFTSITILMNNLTPPHLTPLTSGLAQSVSSFMRCIGPIGGGLLWAKSIDGGPDGHAWPFNYHLGFWVVGLVAFAGFLHSLTIRG
ncbi:hypothetical protein A4X13_0g1508 [Tilletia indica]|uniref:Major facilitator superfamily (MFS) profile domain-containing protein n=1 Tax=Tilletia indica TaxID=43049 RepID=A0A177TVE3_9BASI|nr:hypothetical protein A4X13_0g1508 [Tilletia indica]